MDTLTNSDNGIARLGPDTIETPPLGLRELTWRRFRRHKMAIVGVVILILLLLYTFGGMIFFTEGDANLVNLSIRLNPPTAEHPYGTDTVGRDNFIRTIYGGQISMFIGLFAMLIEVTVGILVGALSGFYGGLLDSLLMRFTEAMLNIPQLFLLIVMAKYFGDKIPTIQFVGRELSGSVIVIIAIIGFTSWPYLARIVRSQFLSIKENEFILAARATGTPTLQIIFRHILPNCVAPIVVAATLGVANAITLEAYISFLGMGVKTPTATWGNMLENAYSWIDNGAYWMWLFPGLLIVLVVMSINFVGDGLRDALDPKSRAV